MNLLSWILSKASVNSIQKGRTYFQNKRVLELHQEEDFLFGKVAGSEVYNFEIDLKRKTAECDCLASKPCKHLVAVAIHYNSNLISKENSKSKIHLQENNSYEVVYQILDEDHIALKKINPATNKLENVLPKNKLFLKNGKSTHAFQFGIFFLEMLEDAPINQMFSNTLDEKQIRYFSKKEEEIFFGKSLKVKFELKKSEDYKTAYTITPYYLDPDSGEKVNIEFFDDDEIPTDVVKFHFPKNNIDEHKIFHVVRLNASTRVLFRFTTGGTKLFSIENIIFNLKWLNNFEIENLKEFENNLLEFGPIPFFSIFPDPSSDELIIKGRFDFFYSKNSFNSDEGIATNVLDPSKQEFFARFPIKALITRSRWQYAQDDINIAKRNIEKERKYVEIFKKLEIPIKGKDFVINTSKISKFLNEHIPKMQAAGMKINIHKSLILLFENSRVVRSIFDFHSTSSGLDWFDGQIKIEGLSAKEFKLALQAYKKKEIIIKLENGSWISLESIGIKNLLQSFENLGIKVHDDGTIKNLNKGQIFSIEYSMETRTDSAIKNLSKKIKNLPYKRKLKNKNFQSGFLGELRNYQKEGVLFLESLFEIGLGGILADDMGLGKTIQCLTFLDRILSQKKAKLILIVGPLASISVWKKESEKFFKELNLILWHGSDRKKNPLPNKGIILTTYGTLSRDFDDWKDHYTFDITILDEAQNLKNYRSITSHATREIKSRSYYCLTGTPLENNLMDLWSLFDLIFPGYLGKKDAFKKIYSDSNTNSHLLLKEKIEPFLLRRTKENVLTELPSKTEILVPVAMTETQKKFYEEARKQAIIELANAGRDYLIKLLPHLMRLRRIACHPEIGNPLKTNPLQSGKFQHIQDVIEEVVGSSSGILIFSQFTDILKICGKLLEKLGHDYYYLDGSTKIKDREQFVREFQEGQKHIFLISLKAGGTALTLHRADTVMHLDPWWNPAIERQASDRAHRIGQKKKVFVYKLYSEDSIEEKVLELQRKKKDIFDSIFEGNFTTSSQITRQELQELLEW